MTTPNDSARSVDEDVPDEPDRRLARFVGPFLEAGLRLDVGVGLVPDGRWHLWASRLGIDLTGPVPGVLHVFRARVEKALALRRTSPQEHAAIVRLLAVLRRSEAEAREPVPAPSWSERVAEGELPAPR